MSESESQKKHRRRIGRFLTPTVAFGCMNVSHAYGNPPSEKQAIELLNQALDHGYSMLDSAALYGFGANESLIAKAVGHRRDEYLLASKCGMFKGPDGKKAIDGRPETIRKTCEDSLRRLDTDVIDLYYLHRWDKSIPIEDSIGQLSRLVEEGKILEVGLSEVSAATLDKAHRIHPIAAVQSEYSLWTRNPEIALLDKCEEVGAAMVAFSPLGRGILTGKLREIDNFAANDIRRAMPRFSQENFGQNLALIDQLFNVAKSASATGEPLSLAQMAIAWVIAQRDNIIALPGTTSYDHMIENISGREIQLDSSTLHALNRIINQHTVTGSRYNATTQQEIDTEEF
ncbi:aldo/keto reductase [Photobacterium sp. GJ3]|uniref:aldo/keto reductase n=1 Tax=Photobacterium sp. GJ3 TaxID=2829502 RepID=UPI0020132A9E|nr:aldo/keto reductase [Photobacterium sp. GJ3]